MFSRDRRGLAGQWLVDERPNRLSSGIEDRSRQILRWKQL